MILSDNGFCTPRSSRFAPSPTGLLHLGHAFSALTAWHAARDSGGRFRLRLEDIDRERCRAPFAEAILEDLAWLGVDWDGPVRRQSEHMAQYEAVLRRLRADGLLYPCFCSRADILREQARAGSAPHGAADAASPYPGTCRALSPSLRQDRLGRGAAHVWRLDMQAALRRIDIAGLSYIDADAPAAERMRPCRPARFGDVVLARRDMPASYHLCVTHDDWLQEITLVVRGEDLREATELHRLLQDLLGWTAPAYSHHHLLRDAQGRRLAKRDQARTLRALRESGLTASAVRHVAGHAEAREGGGAADR